MALLNLSQIQATIKCPKNKTSIELAAHQDERLVMHCEPILEKSNLPNNAYRNFTLWWQSLITREKYTRISELLGTPLSTISVTKDIFDQLGKFIDAQDRYIEYKFANPDYTNDYSDYLERSGDDEFWRIRCVDALKTEINSIMVVDLPAKQTTLRPEPYVYLIAARNIIDIDINKITGKVEYLIFTQPDRDVVDSDLGNSKFQLINKDPKNKIETVIVIDDEYYRVLSRPKDKDIDWNMITENKHDLGYCPCIDFWSKSIKGSEGINKNGPITSVLRKLDYLLFYRALADYMDLYGPFPILVTYEEEESQFDDKNKEVNYGTNYTLENYNSWDNLQPVMNPRTSKRNIVGPGTNTTVPSPVDANDYNMMESPMKFVGMDVDNLKHVQERITKLENEIIQICTGEDKDYLNEIAKNPEMINATYDSKDSILRDIKREFERTHRFITKCRAELRYGSKYFLGATVDYGSDYFLKDANTLTDEFASAVTAGMPQGYTNEIANAAINTRYKNNIDQLSRMRILNDLEPYKNMDWETLQSLQINICDEINFIIKANFTTFVSRFELQTGSIVDFGSLLPYGEKINIIKQIFTEYATGIKWTRPEPNTSSSRDSGS